MSYTEEQVRKAMEKWSSEAYGNDEDFADEDNWTKEGYIKACSDTIIEYLQEAE